MQTKEHPFVKVTRYECYTSELSDYFTRVYGKPVVVDFEGSLSQTYIISRLYHPNYRLLEVMIACNSVGTYYTGDALADLCIQGKIPEGEYHIINDSLKGKEIMVTKTEKDVEMLKLVKIKEPTFQIELNEFQARVLCSILGYTAGRGKAKQFTYELYNELMDLLDKKSSTYTVTVADDLIEIIDK